MIKKHRKQRYISMFSFKTSILKNIDVFQTSPNTTYLEAGKNRHASQTRKELVDSYRPILLLSVVAKLWEKLFHKRLQKDIQRQGLIPDHQFGLQRKHSTVDQVHRVTQHITEALEWKQFCLAVFLDISQAFDKVWHDGLLLAIPDFANHILQHPTVLSFGACLHGQLLYSLLRHPSCTSGSSTGQYPRPNFIRTFYNRYSGPHLNQGTYRWKMLT